MEKLYNFFIIKIIGRIEFTSIKYLFTGRAVDMTAPDVKQVAMKLLMDRYVGLSYRKTHLTSFFISLVHFVLTGVWRKWSHAWINVDDEISDPLGMQIFESVGAGAIVSPFWDVIVVDAVVLLKPKFVKEQDWDKIHKVLLSQQGTAYDTRGRCKDISELNCVERVVVAILTVDSTALPNLKKMMDKKKQLTPQMLYDCGDFEICLEIRR